MNKARMGLLLLAVTMLLNFPASAICLLPPATDETVSEEPERYCAYAMDTKLYAFLKPGENQDSNNFDCELSSDDIVNPQFQYLKPVTQTDGNVHYIFVVEGSNAMGQYQEEISAYLQSISKQEQMKSYYTLAVFGEGFDVVQEKMTDINTVLQKLEQVSFQEGYTDPYSAVKSVNTYLNSYLRDSEDLVSIVLFTSGQTNLRNMEQETDLVEEANQVIHAATDVIYSTFCTKVSGNKLTAGNGLHALVLDTDSASDAGERLAELMDSLYCACFKLEQTPVFYFSFELILKFGKDTDDNWLNITKLAFDSIHTIQMQDQGDLQPFETDPFQESEPGDEETEEPPEIQDGSDSSTVTDSLTDDGEAVLSTPGKKVDVQKIVLIVCVAVAIIAAVAAGLLVYRKGRTNAEQNKEIPKTTQNGIPLKLEIYSGRCKNKSAFLKLSESLTIGSADDCDIIFDNPEVAAKNSCIKLVNGQVYIEDLNSPQGTALDGMRFQGQNKLHGGEVISIGSVEFSISFVSDPEPGTAV